MDSGVNDSSAKVRIRFVVRRHALATRGGLPLDALIKALDDPVADVRRTAFLAAQGGSADEIVAKAIVLSKQDPDAGVRRAAALALADWNGWPRPVAPKDKKGIREALLRIAAKDADRTTRQIAKKALGLPVEPLTR